MTIAAGTAAGANQLSTAGTSLPIGTINTAIGEFLVVVVASDNIQTTNGVSNNHTNLQDDQGHTYTKLIEYTYGQGSAAAGATVSIWVSSAMTVTQITNLRATFSASLTAKAGSVRGFTVASGKQLKLGSDWVNTFVKGESVDPSSLAPSGLSSKERLYVRGIAGETNATTVLTPSSSWTAMSQSQTSGGGAAANMAVRGEFRILTGTGATSDPTWTAVDSASALVWLEEATNVVTGAAALTGASGGSAKGYPLPVAALKGRWNFSDLTTLFSDTAMTALAAADAAIAAVQDRKVPVLPIPNASVETAPGGAGSDWYANWSGGSDPGPSVARVADGTAPFGSFVGALSQANAVAGSQPAASIGHPSGLRIFMQPGVTYRISCYVKASRADQDVEIFGNFQDAANGFTGFLDPGSWTRLQPSDGWVRLSELYTPGAGTVKCAIGVRGLSTTTTGEMFRWDAFQVEEAADTVRPFYTGTLNPLVQATSGARPVRKDAIQNGNSVGRFDGTDDTIAATLAAAIATPYTFLMVVKQTSVDVSKRVLQLGSVLQYNAGGVNQLQWTGGAADLFVGGFSPGSFGLAAFIIDGTNSKAWAFGGSDTGSGGTSTLSSVTVSPASSPMNSDMAELVIFDTTLSNADLNKWGQYLADEWGVSWTNIVGGVTGAADLTGTGSLTATGRNVIKASATLTGTGTLASGGTRVQKGVSALTGAGALSATSKRTARLSGTLTGAGALGVATTKRTVYGVAALSGAGALSVTSVKRTVKHTAVLTGLGGIVADGNVTGGPIVGVAVLSGQSGGTVGATKSTIRAVGALTGLGGSTVAGKRIAYRTAALTGAGALASGGKRIAYGAPVLTGAGALTSSGKRTMKSSTVPLTGAGSLGATGKAVKRSGTVVLTGSGAVTGSLLDYSAPTDYRLDVYDLAGSLIRSDTLGVDYSPDLVYAYALNGPGAIGFQLPTRKAGVTQANFAVGQRTLKLYRNDVLVWAGYLTGADGDRDWVNFRGLGWYEGLRHRLIDKNQHFYSIEALNIAWALIAYTQGKTDLGITRDPAEVASGKLRNRDYCCDDFTLVSEAIEDLAGMHDGFDFWVTPDKVWKTASPRRGVDKTASVIFDALFNLTEVSYGIGSEDMATEVFYVGPNTDECRDLDSMVDATGLATYGRHELGLDTTNIKSDAERDEIAAEVLRYQAVPLSQATVTVPAELGIDPGDFDLGDRVRFRSDDGWLTFDQTMRVIDFAVHVGEGCVEEQVVQLDSVFA